MSKADLDFSDIDLTDSQAFVPGVPHEWFAFLRKNAPVWWQEEANGPGFWAVTGYEDCNTVNRDYGLFSSHARGTYLWDMDDEQLLQQQLIMLNMDPPIHTRYRRLVNKGFTPRVVKELHDRIHAATDVIIDEVIEDGRADFVTKVSAELPLVVIAELLGVPNEDRHRMFDWSNQMIGNEDPEYQDAENIAQVASMELYAYASKLFAQKRIDPHEDLMSVLTGVELEGEHLSDLELELFFLLLTVAGNETTRNLISGAMVAFFDNPDQWELLRKDRSLLPSAIEEMLRYVTPVMNFRRQSTAPTELSGQAIKEADQKVVFFHVSANRDDTVFDDPQRFDITRTPNPHMAFGGGGPHFCLGANLARMEIRVMFERILDRMPDIHLDGKVERLQSSFINGVKHIPVAFTPGPRVPPSEMARQNSEDLKEVIRDSRRDQVIDVARRLFGQRGTIEVSMDEIASEAGVARSTVYVYFADRDELLRACLSRVHGQLVTAIDETWDLEAAPVDRLRILIQGIFEQLDENPAFGRLALATYEAVTPSGAAVGSELSMIGLEVVERIEERVDEGVTSGTFRALDTDRAVTLIGQQIYGAMSVRAADPLPRPRDEAALEISDFILRGLTA